VKSVSICLLALCAIAAGEIHAVLVAGSKGWSNYRHQADIAHAYKMLTEGGVPKDNIVTFMYDDIASHWTNPFKGKIYNRPANTSEEAVDVYAAVKDNIDYKGYSGVSPKNFLKVLQGEKPSGGTGRTLTSTKDDDVFVYFADHGGVGSLAFPGLPFFGMRLLHADDINEAIKNAHSKNMYKRLVFYTEACESGSVFDGLLPSNISAYAVTAANGKESSWGWYCDSSTGTNKVLGKTMGVCLGDEFSVRWMEDADASNRGTETLAQQYTKMTKAVTKSHPQHFGDMAVSSDPLGDYVGVNKKRFTVPRPLAAEDVPISSRDAELAMLQWRLAEAEKGDPRFNVTKARASVDAEVASREDADYVFGRLWAHFNNGESLGTMQYKPPRHFDCLKATTKEVKWTDYSLKYVSVLSNLCESGVPASKIIAEMARSSSSLKSRK